MDDPNPDPPSPSPPTGHYTDRLRREPWKVLSSAEHRLGPRVVHVDEIESPDGRRRLTWTRVMGHHAVMILAFDDEENVLLVREYRHPLGREIFDLPAGGAGRVEDEAQLLRHAQRELAEETCFTAREWRKLGAYHPIPGLTPAKFHVYVARGLEPVAEVGTGEEWCEIEEVVRVPFRELHAAAVAGEVEDGVTLMAVLWAGAAGVSKA
jgi:ADP-ribose pyrophosphatase